MLSMIAAQLTLGNLFSKNSIINTKIAIIIIKCLFLLSVIAESQAASRESQGKNRKLQVVSRK
jgi:hypothetical protein